MRVLVILTSLWLCGCTATPASPMTPNTPEILADVPLASGSDSCLPNKSVPGSNDNVLLSDGCAPLLGVSVDITITHDLVTTNGFAFQLNADGLKSSDVAWQQYGLAVTRQGYLYGVLNNWRQDGTEIFNYWTYLLTVPLQRDGTPVIPAGYRFTVALTNDPAGNVTGATYTVMDSTGDVLIQLAMPLDQLTPTDGAPFDTNDIGPIGDVEFDVVGFSNRQYTTFLSGDGVIAYHAAQPLHATNTYAACVYRNDTGETSNSLYSDVANGLQTFTHCL
jgi:hypothetical protein